MANGLDSLVPLVFPAGIAGLGLGSPLLGHPEICIAVLDGPVDRSHPCFDGADLTVLPTLVADGARVDGAMSSHGTHVASIIFGQPGSPVTGVAPQCRGLIVPVFADDRRSATQLDLARGIEQAANAGALVINLSGGQLTDFGEAEGWLENAVRLCQERNILLVAAAGNDGCACLHVPAALPNVLAVGAMDARGHPLDFSNWGDRYQQQGILAPGENILGAKPGGGTERLNGTSFATPIVAGVAALLLSEQVRRGKPPTPKKCANCCCRVPYPATRPFPPPPLGVWLENSIYLERLPYSQESPWLKN
ncbi:MAG: S8 family serine peptidase [Nodosilinea sp. LVE1205-7]